MFHPSFLFLVIMARLTNSLVLNLKKDPGGVLPAHH